MQKHEKGRLVYFSYELFDQFADVTNVISSRLGGVSIGTYHSLNIGLHVGDQYTAVIKNRALLCEEVGVELSSLVACEQVHGANVSIVTAAQRGKGAVKWSDSVACTDGLITDVPDIPLFMIVADCAILSFFDSKHRVIALAHGSWRGTVGRIAQKTVSIMREVFGCDPADIVVGIGPSIGPCCYEVHEDVIESFHQAFLNQAAKFFVQQSRGSTHLDLWMANKWQLLEVGIREEHIELSDVCNACHIDMFYSHRAEKGKTGRFGGLIVLHSITRRQF